MCNDNQKSIMRVVGGVYTNSSERFNRRILPGLCRTIKANSHDAAVVVAVSPQKMVEIKKLLCDKKRKAKKYKIISWSRDKSGKIVNHNFKDVCDTITTGNEVCHLTPTIK